MQCFHPELEIEKSEVLKKIWFDIHYAEAVKGNQQCDICWRFYPAESFEYVTNGWDDNLVCWKCYNNGRCRI